MASSKQRSKAASATRRAPAAQPLPGARALITLTVIAVLWTALQLGGLRTLLRGVVVDDPNGVVQLMLYMSGIVLGGTFAGAVAGTLLLWWSARGGHGGPAARVRRWLDRQPRYFTGALGGLVVGVVAGGAEFGIFSDRLGVAALVAGAIGVTSLLGGLASAVRPQIAVTAGLLGTVVLLLVWAGRGYFRDGIVDILRSGDTAADQVNAYGWYALSSSLFAGVAIGLTVYAYLRRRKAKAPLFAYIFAGALPGLMWLLAEVLVWIASSQLMSYAGEVSVLDEISLGLESEAQFNGALAVLFAGAMTALLAVGLLTPKAERGDAATDGKGATRKTAARDGKPLPGPRSKKKPAQAAEKAAPTNDDGGSEADPGPGPDDSLTASTGSAPRKGRSARTRRTTPAPSPDRQETPEQTDR